MSNEQPNTDEIRAAWGSYDYHVSTPWEDVAALCDALDAALARAEAAEAQIAAALDLCLEAAPYGYIHTALTGDTA